MTYLYIYRMTADTGFAPCVDDKMLTLACCKGGWKNGTKTGVRYWIGSKKHADYEHDDVYVLGTFHNKFLYLAKIKSVVDMKKYFSDRRYAERTDCIYEYSNGKYKRNKKLRGVHEDQHSQNKDIAGQYVLISDEFLYFGKDAIDMDIFNTNHSDNMNAKYHETRRYKGDEAEKIIRMCKEKDDQKTHTPTNPFVECGGGR